MSKITLNIRQVDRGIFDLIKSGRKTIEPRAATKKFKNVVAGDTLVFKCGKDRLEKSVVETYTFGSIDELLTAFDLEQIMPNVSRNEAKEIWYSFPGYKEKIDKYGLVAFRLR